MTREPLIDPTSADFYPDHCDRCKRTLVKGEGFAVFWVGSPVGIDMTCFCAQCYVEVVPPAVQINLVRYGETVEAIEWSPPAS